MIPVGLRRHAFTALVLILLVAAEIAVAGGSSEGSAAVRYLFPLLWTLPLLLYRRAPEVAVLTVLGSLAVEAFAGLARKRSTVLKFRVTAISAKIPAPSHSPSARTASR